MSMQERRQHILIKSEAGFEAAEIMKHEASIEIVA